MQRDTLYLTAITFMSAMIIGAVTFALWIIPFLSAENVSQSDSILKVLITASLLEYGTVTSIDTGNNTITISEISRFPGSPGPTYQINIDPSAYIARQELETGPDGTYVALSDAATSTLSAILPGDHVAILLGHRADNALSTNYILFGNPL